MASLLLTTIVDVGKGSKVLKIARKHGITGGTIFYGKGAVNDKLLKLLALTDVKKELVLTIGKEECVRETIEDLRKCLKLDKKGQGICFTMGIGQYVGLHYEEKKGDRDIMAKGEQSMFELITVIVERGQADDVIDLANDAGVEGATVIHGRGSGIHERSKVFAMSIEPEKDVVLLITKKSDTAEVIQLIDRTLDLEKPGSGVLFVQPIMDAIGIYRED